MAEPDNHGNILLTNGRSSQIIKYNYRDNTFKSAYPKFLTMDSIYPIDENPTLRESKQYPSFYYYGIKYDPNRNAYWRFAKMPYKEDDPVITKNYPRIAAILMDTAMNKIAEGILPFGLVNPIPYKEGLLVVNMLESNRESRTILNYLKVDVTKMDPVIFKDYIDEERKNQPGTSEKEETAKFLLKATQSNSAERKIFIVPLEMSCYTCLDPLGQFLKENMEDFKKKNIAFLLISSQPKNLDLYISNNGLKSGVGTVFYKKSTFEIYKVLENWINLKYIEIEDSKISKNKNIFPTDFKTIKILIN